MKKFVFRLEPLYDYRQKMEDACKKEFGAALSKVEEEEFKLRMLRDQHRSASDEIDRLKEQGASMDEITLYYSYVIGVKEYIKAQEKIIAEFRQALEEKRVELGEASKGRRAVEIIKEKSLEAHLADMNRQEQKNTDDINVNRFRWSAGYEK